CEHPGASTPGQGAYYLQRLLDTLTANPDVWSKTVLFVNYDENDGFFDHMPPPNPPSRNTDGTYAGKSTVTTQYEY
ncbi:phospholipase C, phosphocholine-specific, partial [Escherichia coli]|nr:phospholipase C, phosphocholine-specific [Escherichia coli]